MLAGRVGITCILVLGIVAQADVFSVRSSLMWSSSP